MGIRVDNSTTIELFLDKSLQTKGKTMFGIEINGELSQTWIPRSYARYLRDWYRAYSDAPSVRIVRMVSGL